MVSCAYCNKVEHMPYQCTLCMKHFCSVHREPESHQCAQSAGSGRQTELSEIKKQEKPSHEVLPHFIHAHTNVPYYEGHQGPTVIAVELKKSGWNLKLQKRKKSLKDILAERDDERWYVRVKTMDARLSDVLHNIPVTEDELSELATISERKNALPVLAIVASDSAVMLSAKTFMALSP
ncbi:MAG: AN1-type zinc finger domain-containing protein [Nitrososphaerales archaeon]